jgi:hypothetical protein
MRCTQTSWRSGAQDARTDADGSGTRVDSYRRGVSRSHRQTGVYIELAGLGTDDTEVASFCGDRWKIVEILRGIDNTRISALVHLVQDIHGLRENRRICPNNFILTSFFHISKDSSLARLTGFLETESRSISFDILRIHFEEHSKSDKFSDEFFCNVKLFGSHRRIGLD